jgi:peptidoglycan hydrolase-like protein with peptidoglycan-binding domain
MQWARISIPLVCCLSLKVDTVGARVTAVDQGLPETPPAYLAVLLTVRTLSPGDRSANVIALQQFLRGYQLYTGSVDGVYGPDTEAAVLNYQRIRGLSETGVADVATLEAMGFDLPATTPQATPSPQPAAVLSRGDRGANVLALQQQLLNYQLYGGSLDGIYGPETEAAVLNYQRIRGLPETGIADAATLEAMGFTGSGATGQIAAAELAPGDAGPDVLALQQTLTQYGFTVPQDGVYGTSTTQAVSSFQQIRQLPPTGTADGATLAALGLTTANASFPYVAAVIASDPENLSRARSYFPNARLDSDRLGEFINLGNYASRQDAEATVREARRQGFNARVLYEK